MPFTKLASCISLHVQQTVRTCWLQVDATPQACLGRECRTTLRNVTQYTVVRGALVMHELLSCSKYPTSYRYRHDLSREYCLQGGILDSLKILKQPTAADCNTPQTLHTSPAAFQEAAQTAPLSQWQCHDDKQCYNMCFQRTQMHALQHIAAKETKMAAAAPCCWCTYAVLLPTDGTQDGSWRPWSNRVQ